VFVARYPIRIAGSRRHQELWVPAEDLEEFNRHIVGPIEVVAEFRGDHATSIAAEPPARSVTRVSGVGVRRDAQARSRPLLRAFRRG
jgi:hypothetical protein